MKCEHLYHIQQVNIAVKCTKAVEKTKISKVKHLIDAGILDKSILPDAIHKIKSQSYDKLLARLTVLKENK